MSHYNWQDDSLSVPTDRVDIQDVLPWVYLVMVFGMLITTGVAAITASSGTMLNSPGLFLGALILQIILVIALNVSLARLAPGIGAILFFLYAGLNGFVLSWVFLVYDIGTITTAFVSTTALFGAMTLVGFTTEVDLTRFRVYLGMALLGLVIALVVNLFLRSSGLDMLISGFGVLLFTGLTAYDTQRIKAMAEQSRYQDGSGRLSLGIFGALQLYLDFLNLFLFILRLLGRRR